MDLVVSLLFYVVPLILLIVLCACCALIREHRLARRRARPAPVIPIQPSDNDLNPPPPYSAEHRSNFEESLPTYEKATGQSS